MDVQINYNDTLSTVRSNTLNPSTVDPNNIVKSIASNPIVNIATDDAYVKNHTREFYRGKSFRYAGRWTLGVHYLADDYITDFVVKNGNLLVCTKSHMSSDSNEPTNWVKTGDTVIGVNSEYWDVVLVGGVRGKAYRPRYDIDTDSLIWTLINPEDLPDEYSTYLGIRNLVNYFIGNITDEFDDLRREISGFDGDLENMRIFSSHLYSEVQGVQSNLDGVNSIVSDLEGNMSIFQQTADGFLMRVENIEGDVGQLRLTAREFEVRMSNLDGDVAQFLVKANEISTRVENAEGDISQIHQRADEIWSQVENTQGDVSRISQRADEINTLVENALGDVSSISQRADQIQSQVINAQGDISRISQKADEIESTVENTQGDISKISQRADKIESEVNNTIGDVSVLTQTANEIRSRVENAEGDVSRISQKANSIESTVRNNSGDISEIIQRADLIEQTVRNNKSETDGSFVEMESKITQTAREIRSEVNQTITTIDETVRSMNSTITQQADLIEQKVSQTDYDTKIGQIEQNTSLIEQKADRISTTVERVDGEIESTARALSEYITSNDEIVQMLLNQADGAIDTWFYEGVPTLNNTPASGWTTDNDKNEHLGDLYYDKLTGKAYRFVKDGNIYTWVELTDDALATALALASEAKDTADGKRRVFVTQPTPPYDEGDLWVQMHIDSGNNTDNGMIYVCVTSRENGLFDSADWTIAFDAVTVKKAKSAFHQFADAIIGNVWEEDPNGLITSATLGQIKLTKDNINLSIQNTKSALRATGIDITGVEFDQQGQPINGGTVVITADNFKIRANNSQVEDPIAITIVDGHPKINVSSLDVAGIFRTQAWESANQAALDSFYSTYIEPIPDVNYLKQATNNGTLVSGGLVLTSSILLGNTVSGVYQIMSGITGIADTSKYGNGIAAWFGGAGLDRYYSSNTDANNAAKSLFRMDGSGYVAKQNIKWEADGSGSLAGDNILWDANGQLTVKGGILTTELRAGYQIYGAPWVVMSGISGDYDNVISDPTAQNTPLGHGIAAWFGGDRIDKEISANANNLAAATSLFRFDGSGYLANGAIAWGPAGGLRLANNVIFGDGNTNTDYIVQNVLRLASYFTDETVSLDGVDRHILRINTDGQSQSDPGFIGVAWDGLLLTSGDHIIGDVSDLQGLPKEEVRHVILSQQEWDALDRPDPAVIYMVYES